MSEDASLLSNIFDDIDEFAYDPELDSLLQFLVAGDGSMFSTPGPTSTALIDPPEPPDKSPTSLASNCSSSSSGGGGAVRKRRPKQQTPAEHKDDKWRAHRARNTELSRQYRDSQRAKGQVEESRLAVLDRQQADLRAEVSRLQHELTALRRVAAVLPLAAAE